MNTFHGAALASLLLVAGAACSNDSNSGGPADLPVGTVTTATGDQPTVLAALNGFKTALGGANNNAIAGTQPSGFRAVNWDGVAGASTQVNTFAPEAFSNRGLFMETDGTGFRVDTTGFVAFQNVTAGNFLPFSGNRLFASVGSPRMDALFNVPGTLATPATVKGFGVVFVDNEAAGSAKIEPFDAQDRSLGVFSAPVTGNGQFSFVGVTFDSAVVARVRITAGTDALGAAAEPAGPGAGGAVDLVVMDDFVFGEPQAKF